MRLYNTLSKKIEEFIPYSRDEVTMYTCGPTVYNYAHIGNLRTYIFEDVLEKSLNYLGYNVKRCMNITDVGHLTNDSDNGEDKMLKTAVEKHMSVASLANFYTEAFFKDTASLNIKKPSIVESASSHIDDYIKVISKLIDTNYAYQAGGNVYFDVTKLEGYYTLSGKNKEDLMVAVRADVTNDAFKLSPGDFGLWFTNSKFQDQAMKWDSPWGVGYPGWHIECSCLAMRYLGEHLDIHCGGVDNIFPHHSNEIAQSEACLGHKWCNYWVHGEHLNDKVGKMSKSKGEFLTIDLLISKGYNPLAYRLFCLQSHYRKQLVFSYESLDMALNTYNKLLTKIKNLNGNQAIGIDNSSLNLYNDKFKQALSEDLNTANALTVLYDVLKSDINDLTKLELIKMFDTVLSLDLIKETEVNKELDSYISLAIEKRNLAKQNKDFKEADQIRDELAGKGIIIKDTKEGTIVEIVK